jgi:hypothetical protein
MIYEYKLKNLPSRFFIQRGRDPSLLFGGGGWKYVNVLRKKK